MDQAKLAIEVSGPSLGLVMNVEHINESVKLATLSVAKDEKFVLATMSVTKGERLMPRLRLATLPARTDKRKDERLVLAIIPVRKEAPTAEPTGETLITCYVTHSYSVGVKHERKVTHGKVH